jgi:hypothetical protein
VVPSSSSMVIIVCLNAVVVPSSSSMVIVDLSSNVSSDSGLDLSSNVNK